MSNFKKPPKTLVFCTSYTIDSGTWQYRYRKWIDHYAQSGLHYDQLLMIDDASTLLPNWADVEVITDELPEQQSSADKVLFRFSQHLGRQEVTVYPGWFRSFALAAEYAVKYGFEKIVHCESDAYLLSPSIINYVNQFDLGWGVFWCPRWGIPESSLQIINAQSIPAYLAVARSDYDTVYKGRVVDQHLPYTHLIKAFTGDRYGEYLEGLPSLSDYCCQTPNSWKVASPSTRSQRLLRVQIQ